MGEKMSDAETEGLVCPQCKRGINVRWRYCPMCGCKLREETKLTVKYPR